MFLKRRKSMEPIDFNASYLSHYRFYEGPFLFVLVTDTATNFLLFVPMFLLTGGGPAGSTNVMMFEAYKSGFVYGEMGRALAIVVVLLLLVVAVVALQFRLLRRSESER